MNHVDVNNARNKKHKAVMEKIIKDGVDPFDPKYIKKYHTKPILKETKKWMFTQNAYPYKNSKKHFLFIPKKNISSFEQLNKNDWSELFSLLIEAKLKNKIKTGVVFMRFGGLKNNGSSVSHLHLHLIEPRIKNKESKISIKIK